VTRRRQDRRSRKATCKHWPYSYSRNVNWFDIDDREPPNLIRMRKCPDCRATMSLGPATITPAVAIEIRAAELAADYSPIGGLRRPVSEDIVRGWSSAESNMAPHSDEWLAGWLGHEIKMHDARAESA
jgi:hypothetical protein